MEEKRLFPRVPVRLAVHYRDGADLALSFADSLSDGGLFIRTSRPLPIGTEIVMDIAVGEGPGPPVSVRGRVVWERLLGRAGGMGVKFAEPPPERLRKLLTPPPS